MALQMKEMKTLRRRRMIDSARELTQSMRENYVHLSSLGLRIRSGQIPSMASRMEWDRVE